MNAPRVTRWTASAPPAPEDLEAALEKEGFATYRWNDAAGTRYDDHRHEHREVRWVLRGEITIGVGSERWILGPGDRIDMPPKTLHWAQVGPDGVSYLCADR